jgi:penicillin amidase
VDAFRAADLTDLADRLEDWDGMADLESTEATLFHTWWTFLHAAFRELYYDGGRGYFPDRILEEALEGVFDGERTLPPDLPADAARAAAEYADLPWGEAHQLVLDHPLAQVPVAGKLLRFGRSGIPRQGGPYSVNVAAPIGDRPPFRVVWGPSQRHVVDMADPNGSGGFILPGGQSGYPDNPHSFDQLELWNEGRLWLLPLERVGADGQPGVEDRTVATVRLEPTGG